MHAIQGRAAIDQMANMPFVYVQYIQRSAHKSTPLLNPLHTYILGFWNDGRYWGFDNRCTHYVPYLPQFEFEFLICDWVRTSVILVTGSSPDICYRPQRSWGKVMFLQASVILSTGGGGASTWPGTLPGTRYTPWDQVHSPDQVHHPRPGTPPQNHVPPWTRYTPWDQVPPRPGTPPYQVHPPWTRYTPLGPGTSPQTRYTPRDQVHPPDRYTPLD